MEITAYKHKVGNVFKTFPSGIWYGCIDGKEVTGPYRSKESALSAANEEAKQRAIGLETENKSAPWPNMHKDQRTS